MVTKIETEDHMFPIDPEVAKNLTIFIGFLLFIIFILISDSFSLPRRKH